MAEDNELNREIIDTILKDMGLTVDLTKNGLEAASRIRSMQRTDSKTVPIVAMSANAFSEDVKRSLDYGMNEHLSKPINIEKLHATLMRWIKRDKE